MFLCLSSGEEGKARIKHLLTKYLQPGCARLTGVISVEPVQGAGIHNEVSVDASQ